jgi:tryptophan synthase alpha subunit
MKRLGVYLLAGWPNAEVYRKAAEAAAGAADFIELGLPSRNPKYDGPFIRRAHGEAEPVELGLVPGEVYVMAYWEDVRRLASYRPAFIYLGLYAATGIELPVYVERNIKIFREVAPNVFLVAGFAIDSPQKAAAVVRAGADAVVVGTAYLRRLKNSVEEATAFLREIKKAITS